MKKYFPIPGYEGEYSISRSGAVLSHKTKKELKQSETTWGYWIVCLHKNGVPKFWALHKLLLHVFVGPCPKGFEGDHKSRNRSNNRLSNLHYVTKGFNRHNRQDGRTKTSRYKGVFFVRINRTKCWMAQAAYEGKKFLRRTFSKARDAALAYDRAVLDFFGPDALTNKKLNLL